MHITYTITGIDLFTNCYLFKEIHPLLIQFKKFTRI